MVLPHIDEYRAHSLSSAEAYGQSYCNGTKPCEQWLPVSVKGKAVPQHIYGGAGGERMYN
jgi:hypothetical protein